MSDIETPFPFAENPHRHQAEERNRRWVRQMGLVTSPAAIDRFIAADWGAFTSVCYPAAGLDDLALLTGWMSWMGLLDDQQAEGKYRTSADWVTLLPEILPVIWQRPRSGHASGPVGGGPLGRALDDLLARTLPVFSPAWSNRLRAHLTDIFEGLLTESYVPARPAATAVAASLPGYIDIRRGSAMVSASIDLVELAVGRELPERAARSGTYRMLINATTDLICWHNDLYSLAKEEATGGITNLVLVLESAHSCDRPRARSMAIDLIDARTREFLDARARLPVVLRALGESDCVETALQCVEGMQHWVAGNLHWCKTSPRYSRASTEPGSIEDLLR